LKYQFYTDKRTAHIATQSLAGVIISLQSLYTTIYSQWVSVCV